MAWPGMVEHGMTWSGMGWGGMVWDVMEGSGLARGATAHLYRAGHLMGWGGMV